MNYQANSFFLPVNAQSTRPNDTGLQAVNAYQSRREQADFVCLDRQARKLLDHSNPVIAITDIDHVALLLFRYSASSSEARQALLPEKVELIRAGGARIHGRPPRVIRSQMVAQKLQPAKGPSGSGDKHIQTIFHTATTRRSRKLNYLKTAISAI